MASRLYMARTWRLALLALLAGFLAACGSVDRPFSKSADPAVAQNRPAAPPIRLEALNDVPPAQAGRLKAALRQAAARRGLRLVADGGKALRLRGDFEPFRDGAGKRRLAYVFRLRGDGGRVIEEAGGNEIVRDGAGDPWAGIGSIARTRIAETVMEKLSGKLAQMGYGTQGAGLPPPMETLVKAGPGAEKELDPDLLAGLPPPNGGLAGGSPAALAPAPVPAPPPQPVARARPVPAPGAKMRKNAVKGKKPAAARVRISTVAVLPVRGAPGKGNAELTRAMKAVLRKAGWPVVGHPRRDSMLVRGRVSVGRPGAGGQQVKIAWTVKSPTGKVLGVIRQANRVPAGSLGGGFGEAAPAVAEAAAEGIFQLVRKLR